MQWSAHHAAVKALHTSFDEITNAQEELCNSKNRYTRGDRHSILKAIQIFFLFLPIWKVILLESHDTQTYLQQKSPLLV